MKFECPDIQRISREINPTKVGKVSPVKKFRRGNLKGNWKRKKERKKERKKKWNSRRQLERTPGGEEKNRGESRKVCERLSKSKVVKFTVSRGSGAKGKRARRSTWQWWTCTYTGRIVICIVHSRSKTHEISRYTRETVYAHVHASNSEHMRARHEKNVCSTRLLFPLSIEFPLSEYPNIL